MTNNTSLVTMTPAAMAVVEAIAAVGGRPLVVGGAVRDALLNRTGKDLDLEVHGLTGVEELTSRLSVPRAIAVLVSVVLAAAKEA